MWFNHLIFSRACARAAGCVTTPNLENRGETAYRGGGETESGLTVMEKMIRPPLFSSISYYAIKH